MSECENFSPTDAEQAIDLGQLIVETNSVVEQKKINKNADRVTFREHNRLMNRRAFKFTCRQALPLWLRKDFERLFKRGYKAEEICRMLPISVRYAKKLIVRIRAAASEEKELTSETVENGTLSSEPQDKSPNGSCITPPEKTGDIVTSDPIVIDDEEDPNTISSCPLPSTESVAPTSQTSSGVLSLPKSSPYEATVSTPTSSVGPTIARVSSLCPEAIFTSKPSANTVTQQTTNHIPISMGLSNPFILPNLNGLGKNVMIVNPQNESKWILGTLNGVNSPSPIILPSQPSICAPPLVSTVSTQPISTASAPFQFSTMPIAPTVLTSHTALWPGQIHRLLLSSPEIGSTAGLQAGSDLAIVYLGHNCWRPVVLPNGFRAAGSLGSFKS